MYKKVKSATSKGVTVEYYVSRGISSSGDWFKVTTSDGRTRYEGKSEAEADRVYELYSH